MTRSEIIAALERAEGAPVFVFGSNLAGRHGKGAALWARQHRGARYGFGEGHHGNSYAIPTKDGKLQTLALEEIRCHVARFVAYAKQHPHLAFELTPVGCGLAGYAPHQMAPLFRDAPENVLIPAVFQEYLFRALPEETKP